MTVQTTETPSASEPAKPVAATYADIVEACPGADANFIVSQQAAQATKEQAAKAWMSEQQARIEAASKAVAEANAKVQAALDAEAAAKAAQNIGVPSAGTGESSGSADTASDFASMVEALMGRGKSRSAAVLAVAQSHPELHQAFLAETNPSVKAQRLLSEKYDPNA